MHILSTTYSSDNFFVFRLWYFVCASFLAVSLSPVDCGISGRSSFCQVLQPVRLQTIVWLKTIVWLPHHFSTIRKSRVYGLSSVCVTATVTVSTPSLSASTFSPTASAAADICPGANPGTRTGGIASGKLLSFQHWEMIINYV